MLNTTTHKGAYVYQYLLGMVNSLGTLMHYINSKQTQGQIIGRFKSIYRYLKVLITIKQQKKRVFQLNCSH